MCGEKSIKIASYVDLLHKVVIYALLIKTYTYRTMYINRIISLMIHLQLYKYFVN